MKVRFIQCSFECINYRGHLLKNDPINIGNVNQISKDRLHFYPDNDGIPTIRFKMNGGEDLIWHYNKKDERIRNEDFQKIVLYTFG